MADANLYALLFAAPAAVVMVGLYLAVWGLGAFLHGLRSAPLLVVAWLILVIVGIGAHEAIHAVAWVVFGHKRWRSIKFGFETRAMAPYAHCTEPLEVNAYRLGALAPAVVLGLVPYAAGLVAGRAWPAVYGLLFAIAASGDMLVLWLLRGVPAGTLVQDHPSRAGCYLLDNQPQFDRRT